MKNKTASVILAIFLLVSPLPSFETNVLNNIRKDQEVNVSAWFLSFPWWAMAIIVAVIVVAVLTYLLRKRIIFRNLGKGLIFANRKTVDIG